MQEVDTKKAPLTGAQQDWVTGTDGRNHPCVSINIPIPPVLQLYFLGKTANSSKNC